MLAVHSEESTVLPPLRSIHAKAIGTQGVAFDRLELDALGLRTILGATGATWLHPKGVSHVTT